MDYQTPHTPWARPLASGQLCGLYLLASKSEGMHTHARETVELMQRLDLKLDAAHWYRYYGQYWFGGDASRRRLARFMNNCYDVFVFQDVGPDKLDSKPATRRARTPFLKQVRAGAGVVLIGTQGGAIFADAKPAAELPPGAGPTPTWSSRSSRSRWPPGATTSGPSLTQRAWSLSSRKGTTWPSIPTSTPCRCCPGIGSRPRTISGSTGTPSARGSAARARSAPPSSASSIRLPSPLRRNSRLPPPWRPLLSQPLRSRSPATP